MPAKKNPIKAAEEAVKAEAAKVEKKTRTAAKKVADKAAAAEIEAKNELLLTDEYATDYVKASELSQEISSLEEELNEMYAVWEEAMEQLSE